MADITDPEAIEFSNRFVRTAANRLGTLFYEARYLDELRVSDGDIATTIAQRTNHIRQIADLMIRTVQDLRKLENIWFNVGTGSALNVKITNDAGDDLIDGAPGDGRQAITGADVHSVMSRVIDIRKWMADAAFGGAGNGSSFDAMLNTMVVVGTAGNNPLQNAQATTFIANRCGEIVNEYEANSNAKLNHILAVAVNPRNPAQV